MIQYRAINKDEICRELFNDFIRHQKVTKCWRRCDGKWTVKDAPFIDDWTEDDYRVLVSCLKNTVMSGGFLYGAFYERKLKGFVSVEAEWFGGECEYLDLSSIHVSEDFRKNGIGKALFMSAKEWAQKKGAKKLYISAHSAVESQAFYKSMGCVEAKLINQRHVKEEPFDCQLEYVLEKTTGCSEQKLDAKGGGRDCNVIAIVGTNGSGKTTLGKRLSELLSYKHMDVEDYYFPRIKQADESEIPYSNPRTRDEVMELIKADIKKYRQVVFSAVHGDYGSEVNSSYDCIIYIEIPRELSLARVKKRAVDKFGKRVLEGGDMYEQEQRFFEMVESRTMDRTDEWIKTLDCPVIYIDGTNTVEGNLDIVDKRMGEMFK